VKAWLDGDRLVIAGETWAEHELIRTLEGQRLEPGIIADYGIGTAGGYFLRLPEVRDRPAEAPTI
jgi:hypothetical protein